MGDYLTLEESEAGRRTNYESAPVTKAARLNMLKRMVRLIEAGETSVVNALEKAGENTDNGDTFICRYDLRQSVGRYIAAAASRLGNAGKPTTPLAIVQEAIRAIMAPPAQTKPPAQTEQPEPATPDMMLHT